MQKNKGQDVEGLSNLIMDGMAQEGVLGLIKAQIRSSVYNIMQKQDNHIKKQVNFQFENPISKKIQQIPEGMNTLELIQEFLKFFQMEYTLSVFEQECSIKSNNQIRDDLKQRMNLKSQNRPLLIDIIEGYFQGKTGSYQQNTNQFQSTATTFDKTNTTVPTKPQTPQLETKKQFENKTQNKPIQNNNYTMDEDEQPKKSLLGPLPGFGKNKGLNPLGGNQSNITGQNYLGAPQKKDPYAFDMNDPFSKQPAKKQEPQKQIEEPKSNNFYNNKPGQKQNNFNNTQMIQKNNGNSKYLEKSVSEEIEEEIEDYDQTFEDVSDNLQSSNLNKQSNSESQNQYGISQSQAQDMTVDSQDLEQYDYFEPVKT